MLIIFHFIFLSCTVFATEGTKCDCDTFQIYCSEDRNINRTFTMQTIEIKGRPIYYSTTYDLIQDKETRDVILWNDEKNSWMGHQVYYHEVDENIHRKIKEREWGSYTPIISTGKDSICLSSNLNWIYSDESLLFRHQTEKPRKNPIIKSRCFSDNKICSGFSSMFLKIGDLRIKIDNQTDKKFEAKAKAPCIFPFKYKGTTYNSCTKADLPKYAKWCAVAINNETLELKDYGYCEDCQEDNNTITIVILSISSLFLLASILMVCYYYVKRKREKGEIDTMMKGNIDMINDQLVLNKQAAHLSYSGNNEIDRTNFEIGRKLGGGNFGSVHKGMVEDLIHPGQTNKVAVKSVNNPLDPAQIYSLICEIKILDQLEKRLDLVNMVGACTTQFKSGKIWLLLEYCPHGDMKSFLLKNRDVISQGLNDNMVPHEILNTRLFIKWSHSICTGMEYLASKNIMHGDLAARNILITKLDNDESYLAKITDFGLSKAFYEDVSYLKQERTSIPWKWMAVDYFDTNVLTLSSDVWSFGVVFWEILSFGQFPYAGGDADNTIKKIKAGFRLPVPDEVKETDWLSKCYNDVTEMCWQLDPKKRCNFTDLVKIFKTQLNSEEKEKYYRLEQSIIKKEAKRERSYNNMQDNTEGVYSNLMAEVIELKYVDSV